MRAVVQRVTEASVTVEGENISRIGTGYLVLLGILTDDTPEDAELLARKVANLRVFSDKTGKMSLSLHDVGGELLVVSNFTLGADCRRGNRPDFLSAAKSEQALPLYQHFLSAASDLLGQVKTGSFGADMKLSLVNDGPVTIILDTDDYKKSRRG